jgi:glyoxylase-like metal-dependent hydrolase (beta-lactamase superfamily II)
MFRVNGWQVYARRDGDAVTLIDTGAPGSGANIATTVTGIEQIVLTHGHVDHIGSAAELRESTGATVMAGAGDAAVIRGEADMPPAVFEDWEIRIYERVSAGLPDVAPAVPVGRELTDGDVLDFGGGAQILAIPGHTGLAALDVETACFGHGEPIAVGADDQIRAVAVTLTA